MKRIGHIWDKVCSLENCREAVLEEAHTDRVRRHGNEYIIDHADGIAEWVSQRLKNGFKMGPMVEFDTFEAGKMRHITCPNLADAFCVRAAVRIMEPLVYRRMSPRSYCPVKGRGGLRFAKDIRRKLREVDYECRRWNAAHPRSKPRHAIVLKLDIHHFFASIPYETAVNALRRVFKDIYAINFICACMRFQDGVPIGSGFSAMIANAVLIPIDWLAVSLKGVYGYYRYMDDMIFILRSKKRAHEVKDLIEMHLGEIGLSTNNKFQIFRATMRPVNVGGYRTRLNGIFPGQRVCRHLNKLLKYDDLSKLSKPAKRALRSLYGYIKHSYSQGYKEKWRNKHGEVVFRD